LEVPKVFLCPGFNYNLSEEIYGLVVEFGSDSTRIGFIGDDRPRVVIPSAYALPSKRAGDLNLLARGVEQVIRVLKDSEIKDWDGLEFLWDEGVRRRLGLKIEDDLPPLILVESPVLWSQSTRERLCQVAFEKFRVPALFMGKAPVLTVFESGRHTGLVVDIGAGAVSVSPVYDGYVLKNAAVVQRGFGTEWLTEQLKIALQTDLKIDLDRELRCPSEIKSKQPVPLAEESNYEASSDAQTLSPSYLEYHRSKVLDELKESIVQVPETPFNPIDLALRPPKYFEFPTGFNRNFILERFRVGELLFDPSKRYASNEMTDDSAPLGLTDLVAKSLGMCDVDMRSTLVGNIIVCGGGSLLAGLPERINTEFAKLSNFGRVRIHIGSSSNERRFSSWIGGSILGSLAAFQQLWMTKKEFEELGPAAIERKFP
jgi:actin-related protein